MKAVLSLLAAAACAARAETNWTRVAAVDVTRPDGGGFAAGAQPFQYTERELPASVRPTDDPDRRLLFGDELAFRFQALNPSARYQVRARLLSDSADRVMDLRINDQLADARIELPRGRTIERSWPAGVDGGQNLSVVFRKRAGPNAVVSALEIWSSDPTTLRAPPGLADRLRAQAVAVPGLTPRPVGGTTSLDGTWKFSAAPAPDFYAQAEAPAGWPDIAVPGEWVMQGFTVKPNEPAGYFRTFDLPAAAPGTRYRLRFDTVHSRSAVWVNGMPVGTNESCFLPFEFDITDAARPGRNTLAVSVVSESVADTLASATQYAAHPLGGLTRKVQLITLPAEHLAGLAVDADLDPATATGLLRVRAQVAGRAALAVATTLLDPAGQPVGAGVGADLDLAVPHVQAWDPEHPRRYTVRVELKDGAQVLETVEQRVGFRRVAVAGSQLVVNGRPVKLRGANRHETDPLRGRSLTPERWRQDVELFRAANVNYIRTSHYPPPEEFLDLCDAYGFLVECEAPFCWVQHGANSAWQSWDFRDETFFPRLVRGNLTMVEAHRGHPSIVIWSLANESRWSELWAEVHRRVRQADPSRPTSFHDQCWGSYNNAHSTTEIANHHYPDEQGPAACAAVGRPVLFGEYVHVQTYNRRELAADPGVRDEWGRGFARMVDVMDRHDGCLGGAIWAGVDDVFCLPDGRFVGYGMWGSVCDSWRRAKPETWHVRKAYSPVRVSVRALPMPADGAPLRIPLQNRYNFTDLREVGVTWALGHASGTVSAAAAPRSAGELVIALPHPPAAGDALQLVFTDPRGFVCDEESLAFAAPAPAPPPRSAAPLAVSEQDGGLTLRGPTAAITVDAKTGLIREGRAGGRVVLQGGPELMVLPLRTEACAPVDLGVWAPLNERAQRWQATAVQAVGGRIRVEGHSDAAEGWYELGAGSNAMFQLRYAFTSRQALNPRQWGVVLALPRSCDSLAWERAGLWTTYPADHIGRLIGTATARSALNLPPYPVRPAGAWPQDPSALGGPDFTSTKAAVRAASLRDAAGHGLTLHGDGTAAVRAFVEPTQTGLLVCGFHTGGGDPFFSTHLAAERRPIRVGDVLAGALEFDLE